MDQWVEHWLEEILSSACSDVLFVVDKNRIYLEAAMRLRQRMGVFDDVIGKKRRRGVVPIVHAVHTQGTTGVMSSPTNTNYAAILDNPGCADAIVVGTQSQREDIDSRYRAGNLVAIPHAFTQSKSIGVADRSDERDWNQIVCVGRYSKEKNLDVAIEMFAQVHQHHSDARLDFYGSGSEREAMVRQIHVIGAGIGCESKRLCGRRGDNLCHRRPFDPDQQWRRFSTVDYGVVDRWMSRRCL